MLRDYVSITAAYNEQVTICLGKQKGGAPVYKIK